MKYIVMECNEGYAVLMDEESRFVKAADLSYEVGQTVTDPVIMNSDEDRAKKITFRIGRIAAVAASLVLMVSAGSIYYSRNLKPHSTVLISSDANIRLELNKKGKVLHIKCDDNIGKEILKNYDGKGKDMLTVANEILELEKEKGVISEGDTVDFYIESDNSRDYDTYKKDVEKGISDINVNVKGVNGTKPAEKAKPDDKAKPEPAVKPDPAKDGKTPEAPKPPAQDEKLPEPPAPPAVEPAAPAEPPAPPKGESKPAEVKDPPVPPAETPEPPKEADKPAEGEKPEPPKPDEGAEPPRPEAHPEAAPPKAVAPAAGPIGEAVIAMDEIHIAPMAEEPLKDIIKEDEAEPAPAAPPAPIPPEKT
ncbi:anti-sigma-I factor RsgI family protein [Ruminococcus flavefaciens]|uniref:anti-sigma-I factor RsgI family protein n=1 Tax=Ruminococcus flavefaciens TaxID=1265 RepID=UPI00048CB0EC|nr:hypothetical protein [Ruminococcus flavefaciens]